MAKIRIECALEGTYGPYLLCLELPTNSKIADVIKLLELEDNYICSIWSRKASLDTVLLTGDRLELNRPLVKNPMQRLDKR